MLANTVSTKSCSYNLKNNSGFWHLSGPRSYEQSNNFSIFWNNNSGYVRRFTIEDNGNVGIGTANPTQKLEVTGNIKVNGSYLTSDRRYKDKIESLEKPMDLLNTINGVSYEYKRGEFPEQDFKEGKSLGFVAQDFEKSLPELLIKDEKGFYAVNYDGVIPILVEAVKELNVALEDKNKRAATDETKIQNLESENESIKKEMSELKALVKELIVSQDQNQAAKAQSNIVPSFNKATLYQNTPNPTDGNTEISYLVESKVSNVTIDIYDVQGQLVQRFDNLPTGKNSVSLTEKLQPGIYLYTLLTDGQEVSTKRMIVMK